MVGIVTAGVVEAAIPARVRASAAVLIAVNLVPLYGVLFWDWPVLHLLGLYWAENVLIGGINVVRMALVQPHGIGGLFQKALMIPFFCVHYGMFCAVHGAILYAVFAPDGHGATDRDIALLCDLLLGTPELRLGVMLLAASHLWSFASNDLFGREISQATLDLAMFRPYGRIVILHVIILLGGFVTMKAGSPVPMLVVLAALKIWIDLSLHRRAHRVPDAQPQNPDPRA
jgi:hypothetical protein